MEYIKKYEKLKSDIETSDNKVNFVDIMKFWQLFRSTNNGAYRQDVFDLLEQCRPECTCLETYERTLKEMHTLL